MKFMDDNSRHTPDPSLEEEVAQLRVERDQLYAKVQAAAAEAQRDLDIYQERRRLEYEIATLKRGNFPGSPPSEHGSGEDYDA